MKENTSGYSPEEMLKKCCDWLMQQFIEPGIFHCTENEKEMYEWYMFFYPVRTLLLGSRLFQQEQYKKAAFKVVDLYLSEQLPNGAFTSNYRKQSSSTLTREQFEDILRNGKVNIADNSANVMGIIVAAAQSTLDNRKRYLDAAQRWLDNWLSIWALPEGGYGNGIWVGHKINTPYTCAMGKVAVPLCAFSQISGDTHYADLASRCMAYQCHQWLEDEGIPINMNCYPTPRQSRLVDYGHSFYLLEGLCWTHKTTGDSDLKNLSNNG